MNKDDFISELKLLNEEIFGIKRKISSLKSQYIDENDMRLEDYTTDQLRAELARRNKLAREAARKNSENKPKYITIDGIVKRVLNDKGPFSRKKWEVEIPEDFANEHKIKQVLTYGLLGGAFTKDTAPKVGDKVILRCRLTKACPRFTQGQARIISITNGRI